MRGIKSPRNNSGYNDSVMALFRVSSPSVSSNVISKLQHFIVKYYHIQFIERNLDIGNKKASTFWKCFDFCWFSETIYSGMMIGIFKRLLNILHYGIAAIYTSTPYRSKTIEFALKIKLKRE